MPLSSIIRERIKNHRRNVVRENKIKKDINRLEIKLNLENFPRSKVEFREKYFDPRVGGKGVAKARHELTNYDQVCEYLNKKHRHNLSEDILWQIRGDCRRLLGYAYNELPLNP